MGITDVSLATESQERYLTYALSVVSGRALPDVRDGLKPVQRRILYAMFRNLNLKPSHNHRKSAAVVGEVLARYHPHGDSACYDAMVRMAQDFSLRYPLVDGQGNFGSLDGDNAAAYRYTEAKLRELAIEVLGEIDEETVHFRDNFDATTVEPVVLPSRVPNLLINGASGIAVGMATSIPPHNLRDICKALVDLSLDPELNDSKLATIVKGPDFPSGCLILNTKAELNEMYRTGRGSVRMRGEWKTEDLGRGKLAVVVTSIPYAVNKSQLVEKIAGLIIDKKLPQLVDIRDESTVDIRIVLELASGADAAVAMAYLFKHTALEGNFPVNITALVPGPNNTVRPEVLSLKACLEHFLNFRREVTIKRLEFEQRNLLARIHILEGLVKIFDALDEAIKIVRKSDGRADSAEKLQARFKLSEIQALAVVDMRIYQLSKTNIDEIRAELEAKATRIEEITKTLKSKAKIDGLVRQDLESVAERFGDKRRCDLIKDVEGAQIEFNEADYVVQEDVFAIVTRDGWLKRIRQNNELGSTRLREGDTINQAHALSTVDSVALITNQGFLYLVKVDDFPASSGYGEPVQKLLKFKDEERIVDSFAVREGSIQAGLAQTKSAQLSLLKEGMELVLVSAHGMGFALKVTELAGTKRTGKRIMKLRESDTLAAVTTRERNLALFVRSGSGLIIAGDEIPVRDSAAVGVILMGVRDGDSLVAAIGFASGCKFEVTTSNGSTKSIPSVDLTEGHRGLKGNKIGVRGEIKTVVKEQ